MHYFLVALLSSVPVISSACGGGSQFNLYSFWPLIQGIGFLWIILAIIFSVVTLPFLKYRTKGKKWFLKRYLILLYVAVLYVGMVVSYEQYSIRSSRVGTFETPTSGNPLKQIVLPAC
jgi:cell division protein FtsW (lipid II flippase)